MNDSTGGGRRRKKTILRKGPLLPVLTRGGVCAIICGMKEYAYGQQPSDIPVKALGLGWLAGVRHLKTSTATSSFWHTHPQTISTTTIIMKNFCIVFIVVKFLI